MTDGNKRYLGDVWINEENLERQRAFFTDIMESYQYKYGGEFDASTLRGFTPEDFATAEQGRLADNSIQAPLLLGRKQIANVSDPQYIYTDAVLIDDENSDLMAIDWFKNINIEDVEDASLSHILILIRQAVNDIQTLLQNGIDSKLDSDIYYNFYEDEFTDLKDSVSEVFEEFTDADGNVVTKLNASLVNGLRFILITQEAYDALPETDKTYWRNIYIIRDPSDIPPDYADPMKWQLTDGYTFAIHDRELQITNGLSDEWKTLCSLDDLLNGADIEQLIRDFVTTQSYTIPSDNLLDSLYNINPSLISNDWQNYPFLTSDVHDDFIAHITVNGSSNNVTETVNSTTKFKTANINMNSIINNSQAITSINQALDDTNNILTSNVTADNSRLKQLENQVTNIDQRIANDINPKNTSQDTQILDLQSRLEQAENVLEQVKNKTYNISTNMGKWDVEWLGGLVCPVLSSATKSGTKYTQNYKAWCDEAVKRNTNFFKLYSKYYISNVQYNEQLGLARIYVSFLHWHRKENARKWVEPSITYTNAKNKTVTSTWETYNKSILGNRAGITLMSDYSDISINAQIENKTKTDHPPFSNIVFPNRDYPSKRFINIRPDVGNSKVYVYVDQDANVRVHFYGSVLYSLQTGGLIGYEGDINIDIDDNNGE